MSFRAFVPAGLLLWFVAPVAGVQAENTPLRIGIIGCDTSHASAFPKAMRDPRNAAVMGNAKIVAALPRSSDDFPPSRDRVAGYTKELKDQGIEIVDSPEALLAKVDAVMMLSGDGRKHLEYSRAVLAAKKPLFIDKPVTTSLADALEIDRLAKETGTPWFSTSSLRFTQAYADLKHDKKLGAVLGCDTSGPCHVQPPIPYFFWYGIHGVEILYSIMGPGCESVACTSADGIDVVVGKWKDGRVGSYHGLTGKNTRFGATVYGDKGTASVLQQNDYVPTVAEVVKFLRTGKPPVDHAETIEVIAFLEAACESKELGGKPVALASIYERARSATASAGK